MHMPKINLSNSIYQQKGSAPGLTVKDGMLINNRPDGVTGIRMMCDMKKALKRSEKVSIIAEGTSIAELKSEMFS